MVGRVIKLKHLVVAKKTGNCQFTDHRVNGGCIEIIHLYPCVMELLNHFHA